MAETNLQDLVQRMSRERYEEIRKGLQELRLGKGELRAWLEINKKLNTFGDDHKFAERVNLDENPLAEHE